jgi:hypothetical protein
MRTMASNVHHLGFFFAVFGFEFALRGESERRREKRERENERRGRVETGERKRGRESANVGGPGRERGGGKRTRKNPPEKNPKKKGKLTRCRPAPPRAPRP